MNKDIIKETFEILFEECRREVKEIKVSSLIFSILNENKKFFTKIHRFPIIEVKEAPEDLFEIVEVPAVYDEDFNVTNNIK